MAFTLKQQNWRWMANNAAEPTTPLADENTSYACTTAAYGTIWRLRVTIAETGGTGGSITPQLQYSFDEVAWNLIGDQGGTVDFNWANGAGTSNSLVTSFLTTDATAYGECHENRLNAESWTANQIRELDCAIISKTSGTLPLGTIYFRMVNNTGTVEVPLNSGETHPSITITLANEGINVSKVLVQSVLAPPAGISVSKLLAQSVLSPQKGISIAKANTYVVTQPPIGLSISKAITYVVIDTNLGGSLFFATG